MNLRNLREAINQNRGDATGSNLPAQVNRASEGQGEGGSLRIAGHPRINRVNAVDDVEEYGTQPFFPYVFTAPEVNQSVGDTVQGVCRERIDAHEFDDDGNIIEEPQIPLIDFSGLGGVARDLGAVPRDFVLDTVTDANEGSGVRLYAGDENYSPFRTDFGRLLTNYDLGDEDDWSFVGSDGSSTVLCESRGSVSSNSVCTEDLEDMPLTGEA